MCELPEAFFIFLAKRFPLIFFSLLVALWFDIWGLLSVFMASTIGKDLNDLAERAPLKLLRLPVCQLGWLAGLS